MSLAHPLVRALPFARFCFSSLLLPALLAGCSDEASPAAEPSAAAGTGGAAAGGSAAGGSAGSSTVPPPKRPEPTGPCGAGLPTDPEPEVPIHTPRWAFEPWISKDISDTADTYAFVAGFAERGIPVGVVVLDSPWESNYNSLVASPTRYPEFAKLVSDLRAKEIRTVLWLTPFINDRSHDLEPGGDTYVGPSSNYAEAEQCKFFINDAYQYNWWKGKGCALDFNNPAAIAWWHWQLDKLLVDQDVAGFKLDFGENYVRKPTIQTFTGEISHQDYSESYYRDFYRHGVKVRGRDEFVTMVRPYDKSYEFAGRFFARKEHAPTAWVGDNRRDWFGFNDALDHIFRSAAAGYVVVGSDIGGYLDRDDANLLKQIPADGEVFLRWTALGALTPFMQLHGRANLTPWTVPGREDESVAAWRYWATLHRELVPFFYSLAEEAYTAGAPPILRPEGTEESWAGDYRFAIGEAFFVAPLVAAGGARAVALPAGNYVDWWTGEEIAGSQTITATLPDASKIPLYLRQGAIVPLAVTDDLTGLGLSSSAGALTVLVYPGAATSRFVVHGQDSATAELTYSLEASLAANGSATVTIERAPEPAILRIRGSFSSVSLAGSPLAEAQGLSALNGTTQGFWRDEAAKSTWVRVPVSAASQQVIAAP